MDSRLRECGTTHPCRFDRSFEAEGGETVRRLLPVLLLPLAACGYSAGQVTSGEGRSIAVPLFKNQTYRRDLERDLTRAVQQEIVARTDFHLINESADPDLVIKGKLDGHGLKKGDVIAFASVGAGMNINAVTYRMP